MTQTERNTRRLARQLAERAAGDSRFGYDVAGTRYSKDVGDEVARVQGIIFVGPDNSTFIAGSYHTYMPTRTRAWHKSRD